MAGSHLRQAAPGTGRSIRLRDATVTTDQLHVEVPHGFDAVDISGTTARRDLDVELRHADGGKVARRHLAQPVPSGRSARIAPTDWGRLSRGRVEQLLD